MRPPHQQLPPTLPAPPYPPIDLQRPSLLPSGSMEISIDQTNDSTFNPETVPPLILKPQCPKIIPGLSNLLPPPTVAESVTHSEFESLCAVNELYLPADQHHTLRDLTIDRRWLSRESVETGVSRELTEAVVNGNGMVHVSNELHQDKPKEKETQSPEVRRISLPDAPSQPLNGNDGEPHKRWSVCDRPRFGQVAQVASAWEQYFNPSSLRSSRATSQSTLTPKHGSPMVTKRQVTSKIRTPRDQSAPNVRDSDIRRSSSGTSQCSSTEIFRAMQRSCSQTFSSISSLNGGGSIDQQLQQQAILASMIHPGAVQNQNSGLQYIDRYNDLVVHSISSDSIARISEVSSSTPTMADERTPTEEYPGTMTPIDLFPIEVEPAIELNLIPTIVTVPVSQPAQIIPYRPRSISTPAVARRPLAITVERHQLNLSPKSSLPNSSTSSVEIQDTLSNPEDAKCGEPIKNGHRMIERTARQVRACVVAIPPAPAVRQSNGKTGQSQAVFNGELSHSNEEKNVETTTVLRRRATVNGLTDNCERESTEQPRSIDLLKQQPPLHATSLQEKIAGSPPVANVEYSNNLKMIKLGVDETRPYPCHRAIHKRPVVQSELPMQESIPRPVNELPIVKSTALSPAAERYEQHVRASMAQRQSGMTPAAPWQIKQPTTIWATNNNNNMEDGRGVVEIPARTPYEHQWVVSNHEPNFINRIQTGPELMELQGDMETMDPELWQQKLGLIARWQNDVDYAMRAGQTDLRQLFQSPEPCRTGTPLSIGMREISMDDSPGGTLGLEAERLVTGGENTIPPYALMDGGAPWGMNPPMDRGFISQVTDQQGTVSITTFLPKPMRDIQTSEVNNLPLVSNCPQVTFQAIPRTAVPVSGRWPDDRLNGEAALWTGGPTTQNQLKSRNPQHFNQSFDHSPPLVPVTNAPPILQRNTFVANATVASNRFDAIVAVNTPTATTVNPYLNGDANMKLSTTTSTLTQPTANCAITAPIEKYGPFPNLALQNPRSIPIPLNQPFEPSSVETVTNQLRPNPKSFPLYEGMENWSQWPTKVEPVVQWTRIQPSVQAQTSILQKPRTVTEALPADRDRVFERSSRRRSVTRVQLTVPKPIPVTEVSPGLTDPTNNGGVVTVVDDGTSRRPRPTLRRAATISPIRRRSETCVVELTQSVQQAPSSGFASAGSIVPAAEDTVEGLGNRTPSPLVQPPIQQQTQQNANAAQGAVIGLPPPANVHAYPFVSDVQKGDLTFSPFIDDRDRTLTPNRKSSPEEDEKFTHEYHICRPIPSKFLLGRVASNEDICIETETPFSLTISATDQEISITRTASSGELFHSQTFGNDVEGRDPTVTANKCPSVPVRLRLTFGSESNLPRSKPLTLSVRPPIKPALPISPPPPPPPQQHRATYTVDLPEFTSRPMAPIRRPVIGRSRMCTTNSFPHSLPCLSYHEDQARPFDLTAWSREAEDTITLPMMIT